MKVIRAILLASTLLSSLSLSAGNADVNDSWKKLSRTSSVIFRMPQVIFGSRFIRVNKTCIDGDQLRSLKEVRSCIRYDNSERDNCIKYKRFFAFTPLDGTKRKCTRFQNNGDDDKVCVRYEDVSFSIPTDYQIPVYRKIIGGRDENDFEVSSRRRPKFVKSFTIPSCN